MLCIFFSCSDTAELQQAVLFLHENGVLLHYNDSTLRDFYFLDPQWLCDMLAQVVTIKEINPFVKNGVMKIDDINQLIKTSGQASTDRKYAYIPIHTSYPSPWLISDSV